MAFFVHFSIGIVSLEKLAILYGTGAKVQVLDGALCPWHAAGGPLPRAIVPDSVVLTVVDSKRRILATRPCAETDRCDFAMRVLMAQEKLKTEVRRASI